MATGRTVVGSLGTTLGAVGARMERPGGNKRGGDVLEIPNDALWMCLALSYLLDS